MPALSEQEEGYHVATSAYLLCTTKMCTDSANYPLILDRFMTHTMVSRYVHFGKTKSAEKAMRMIDGDGDGELDKAGAFIGEIDLDPQWASELSTYATRTHAMQSSNPVLERF